ncbi:NADH-cytochrome b5 reductase-like [Amphibalanus amphitrite]|uniref:NADH-cytochrome b5 reductase-like n=1 Tax=Amphibalanus amphitrite TaxID=1232801 RepID=UPI001C90783B|nr:NADH-cytochrome b5 reductase-like [Amphibalanus amphitrite]XP_043220224.1 NADH-cytochrome b5 reductase-like [Amphibalanus amphitrite]
MNSYEQESSVSDHSSNSDECIFVETSFPTNSADKSSTELNHSSNESPGRLDRAEGDHSPDTGEEPRRPLDSECCGSGCSPCVFDLYDRDLAAWRRRRLRQPELATISASPLRPDRFTALTLTSITALSDSASLYRFSLPAGTSLCLPPGGHLRLRADDAGRSVTRAYTPVSPPDAQGYFEVYIRLYPSGAMSSCVRRWRVGQPALWSGPFGEYRPRPTDRRLVFLAAGTGVAPFVNLVRAAVEDEDSETRLTLLLAVRRLQDVFPRDQLAQWASYWNFTYQLFVSGAREGTDGAAPRYREPVRWRRLQERDVREVALQSAAGSTRYLVCGTRSFEKDVLNYLQRAGVCDDDVFRF